MEPLRASVVVAAIATAFVAGRYTAPTPATEVTVHAAPTAATAPTTPPAATAPPVAPQKAEPAGDCEQKLAIATDLLEALQRASMGEALAFPPDLPAAYQPAHFEQTVLDALEGCEGSELELEHVDCSEFPCMAFFAQPSGSKNHGIAHLRSCDSWTAHFHGGAQANSRFATDDGIVEYSVATPRPPGAPYDDNAARRWKSRLQAGEAELMAEWGGRELTEVERLDEKIRFWEDAGAPDMADEARARRAKLLAEP
jgi:hypothetical protein